jgi:hypothetical protein
MGSDSPPGRERDGYNERSCQEKECRKPPPSPHRRAHHLVVLRRRRCRLRRWLGGRSRDRRYLLGFLDHRCHELISAPRDRYDVGRLVLVVVESFTESRDVAGKGPLLYDVVGPQQLQQLSLSTTRPRRSSKATSTSNALWVNGTTTPLRLRTLRPSSAVKGPNMNRRRGGRGTWSPVSVMVLAGTLRATARGAARRFQDYSDEFRGPIRIPHLLLLTI